MLIKFFYFIFATIILFFSHVPVAQANHSMHFDLMFISPSQNDLNMLRARANDPTPISTGDLGSGYELAFAYQYRFNSSMFALLFRPSYITQSTTGSGADGTYSYSLSGITLFPMLRLYPLENKFLKFFMQMGLGYGSLTTEVKEGPASVTFSGSNFGAIAGLGSEFCFTANHCMVLEGNVRYLPFERNIASSSSGSFQPDSITTSGGEVEVDNRDLATTLSGFQAGIGYILYF